MKKLFTSDPTEISNEINSLIEKKISLACAKGGTDVIKKFPLVTKSTTSSGDLIVIFHPEPACDSTKCVFYYHSKGSPLRYFETERVKKADQYLGLKYPKEIYNVFRRKHPRVSAGRQSTVTFSIAHRQRLFTGTVVDISLNGAQVSVDIRVPLSVGDTLCALSFILYSRLLEDYEETLTLSAAKIVWLQSDEERIHTLGLYFDPDENSHDSLNNYINLRGIEDPHELAV